jgi:hypothetical protein
MRFPHIALPVLASLLAPCAMGAIQRVECPSEIPVSSLKMIDTRPGWKTFISAPLFLHDAAPTDGPPERLGTQMGERIRKTKSEWAYRYSLEGPFPEGKWLQCDYGMLNEFSLSKRLDDDTKECTVTGRKGEKAGQNMFDIVCK